PPTSIPPLHDALPIYHLRRAVAIVLLPISRQPLLPLPQPSPIWLERVGQGVVGVGPETRCHTRRQIAWNPHICRAAPFAPRMCKDRKSTRLNSSHGSI